MRFRPAVCRIGVVVSESCAWEIRTGCGMTRCCRATAGFAVQFQVGRVAPRAPSFVSFSGRSCQSACVPQGEHRPQTKLANAAAIAGVIEILAPGHMKDELRKYADR